LRRPTQGRHGQNQGGQGQKKTVLHDGGSMFN